MHEPKFVPEQRKPKFKMLNDEKWWVIILKKINKKDVEWLAIQHIQDTCYVYGRVWYTEY